MARRCHFPSKPASFISYEPRDIVRDLRYLSEDLTDLLVFLGFPDLEFKVYDPRRARVGEIRVELQKPDLFERDYRKVERFPDSPIPRGYCVSASGDDFDRAFVNQDSLSQVASTIGHELGHLFSRELNQNVDEEGKAYAFEAAWDFAIQSKGFLGLNEQYSYFLSKATDQEAWPVHYEAFTFVVSLLKEGYNPCDLYGAFVRREIHVPSPKGRVLIPVFN